VENNFSAAEWQYIFLLRLHCLNRDAEGNYFPKEHETANGTLFGFVTTLCCATVAA